MSLVMKENMRLKKELKKKEDWLHLSKLINETRKSKSQLMPIDGRKNEVESPLLTEYTVDDDLGQRTFEVVKVNKPVPFYRYMISILFIMLILYVGWQFNRYCGKLAKYEPEDEVKMTIDNEFFDLSRFHVMKIEMPKTNYIDVDKVLGNSKDFQAILDKVLSLNLIHYPKITKKRFTTRRLTRLFNRFKLKMKKLKDIKRFASFERDLLMIREYSLILNISDKIFDTYQKYFKDHSDNLINISQFKAQIAKRLDRLQKDRELSRLDRDTYKRKRLEEYELENNQIENNYFTTLREIDNRRAKYEEDTSKIDRQIEEEQNYIRETEQKYSSKQISMDEYLEKKDKSESFIL